MKRLLPLAALAFLMTASVSLGSVIVVDCSGGGDYLTLRDGIEAAVSGDTVRVAPGTYTGPDNRDLDFAGKAIVVASECGPEDTVIDCGSAARAFDFHSAEPMAARLSGFTITNGSADNGGAIFCRSISRPTIDNCVLTANRATNDGGALSVISSAGPILENVTFDANESGLRGGAICTAHGRTVLNGCSFTGNSAPYGGALMLDYDMYVYIDACDFSGNSALEGGAIFDYGSSPSITGSTFTGNRGDGPTNYRYGGAVYIANSDYAVITDCIFEGNEIHGWAGFGGGLAVDMARATVTSCVFSSNTATGEEVGIGGGVYCYNEDDNWGPAASFDDCTFVGNRGGQGGGMCCQNTRAPIRSCAFLDNEAGIGGGAYLSHHPGPFSDCIVAGNTAETGGGGLRLGPGTSSVTNSTVVLNAAPHGGGVYCSANATPYMANSIVALNASGGAVQCNEDIGSLTLSCCDLYGNVGGDWVDCVAGFAGIDGNLCEDPLFCGAPTGDFSIDAASPCAPANAPECGLIGALDVGCETTVVRPASWGEIKSMFR